MPIVEKDGAVRQALMGTMTQVLGLDLTTSGLRQNNDGPWVLGGRPSGRGLSPVLLQPGSLLGHSLTPLHHPPDPARPTPIQGLPFEKHCYDRADTDFARPAKAPA